MPISLREARASRQDRNWIDQAYGEYLADLSADHTGVFPSLAVTGQSATELVQSWFRDDRSVVFLILREEKPAGFALVQRDTAAQGDRARHYRLSEFFVRRPFRRLGVGRDAALLLFARFAGEWTISEQARNSGAVRFWRRVVSDYTNGDFRERREHGEVAHYFTSTRAAPAR